jgi:hypothetical protein
MARLPLQGAIDVPKTDSLDIIDVEAIIEETPSLKYFN